jgi:tetratricopeptide (TPR) repeat protein
VLSSRTLPRDVLFALSLLMGACETLTARADELEDVPSPIEEASPRSAREQTHLDALSLYAAGRIEEQKDHLSDALRLYQRALRCDPEALPIIREIVPLAFNLERPNEAVRYALKAAEIDPSDPLLLRQLGLHLAEAGRFQQALKLYKQARANLPANPPSPAYILLSMEMGRLCFVTDHPQEAAEAFAIVLPAVEDPDKFGLNETQKKLFVGTEGVRSLELMAEAFLAADRPEDAQTAYERLDAMRPNKALHAFHLARVAAAQKQPQAALDKLQVYFDEQGITAGTAPYQMLVRLLTELGQQDKIVERLEAIATAEPKNREVRQTLAAAAVTAGQFDKAEGIYKELLKAYSNEDAYLGLIKLYRQAERWQDLVKLLGDAAADRDALDLLDEQVKEIAKDQPTVNHLVETAQHAYQADPDSLDYGDRMALALIALEARKFDAAQEFFNLALKVKREDAAGLFEAWGVGLILAEQYADAAAIFRRAINEQVLPEGNSVFHHYLAGALEMAGKTDEALAVAREAIAMPDAPPRMYSRLAWVLYHAKRNADAEQAYRDFVNRFDSHYESEELRNLLRDARLVLSNLCATRDDKQQAEELLEQVLDEYPENVGALNDLGYLWVEQHKNLDRALRMIQQAIEADPDNEAYLDSLGWAYYQLGQFAEAVTELKKAVAAGRDDPDGVILEHLGDAYEKAGQPEEARTAWQRAIEQLEKNNDAEKATAVRQKLARSPAVSEKAPPAPDKTKVDAAVPATP